MQQHGPSLPEYAVYPFATEVGGGLPFAAKSVDCPAASSTWEGGQVAWVAPLSERARESEVLTPGVWHQTISQNIRGRFACFAVPRNGSFR
jgi:hypothetical protein